MCPKCGFVWPESVREAREQGKPRIGRYYKRLGVWKGELNQKQVDHLIRLGFEDDGHAFTKKYPHKEEAEGELAQIRREWNWEV